MPWQDGAVTRDELRAWCDEVGLELNADAWGRIDRLLGLWRQYGRTLNLVGSTKEDALLDHVQEALQGVRLVELLADGPEITWLDIGSGGGLPGLVVAAVRPWDVVLVEPRERRAAFLELGIASVGMGAGCVIRGRWPLSTWNEKALAEVESRIETSFVVLSARAVFSADRWLSEAGNGVVSRGLVLCHVEIGVEEVGGRRPEGVVTGPRWSVAGFEVGSI